MFDPIPLTILTGFLGSGKTTLLKRFLDRRDRRRVGVVVNELGEVGLDQKLLVHESDRVELVDGGCMCCARRADIAKSLHSLIQRARAGGDNWIDEAVIETSGMADPAPIISTIVQDPWLRNNVSLRAVISVLDAVSGPDNLVNRPEAIRQVAISDIIVLTKGDLRDAADRSTLEQAVQRHVPDAVILDSQDERFDVIGAFDGSLIPYDHERVAPTAAPDGDGHHQTRSFILDLDDAVDWPAFTIWLSALLHRHGDRILRVKGTVFVESTGKPLVVHGVQHVMHPPVHLDEAHDEARHSRLVFITAGLDKETIESSLHRFLTHAAATKSAPLSGTVTAAPA